MSTKSSRRLADAIDHHVAGRLAEAEAGYQSVLKVNPRDATALLWLGVIMGRSGRFEESRKLLARCAVIEPRNALAQLNLGIANAALGQVEPAMNAYRRATALDPSNVDARNNMGVLLEAQNQPAAAAEAYRAAIELEPHNPTFHCNLGNALKAMGRPEEAIEAYRRAVALDPGHATAWSNLGVACSQLKRMADCFAAYRAALACDPALGRVRLSLAQALYEERRHNEAAEELRALLQLEPSNKIAYVTLGLIYSDADQAAEARGYFERALEIDPDLTFARLCYGNCLEALGDDEGAARERARAVKIQRVIPEVFSGVEKAADILMVAVASYGNLPNEFLVDRRRYGRATYYPPDPSEAVEPPPPCALIFNMIADPDMAEAGLRAAQAFIDAAGKPFLNNPAAVLRTKRHLIPDLLAGVPHVLAPRTISVQRTALIAGGEAGLTALTPFPMLMRPAGSHGGENLELITDFAAAEAYLAANQEEALYLTPYVDYRSDDGYFRKYRILFVDREVYPLHLCVDDKWKVHYYTSLMRERQWMRDEEERLLADIRNAFPPPLLEAAREIARRLDLDYAGMDCAITPQGDLLVFEANANMLAHLNDPIEMFPYKHKYVPRVRDAFDAMVRRKLAEGRATA